MPKSNHFPTDPRFPAFRAQVEADYGGSLPDDAFYAGEEMPHEPYHHETALAFRMFAAGWKAALQQAGEPVARDYYAVNEALRMAERGIGTLRAALNLPAAPLPQQTALVEGG